MQYNRKNAGYTLLMILVAITILLLLYFIQAKAFFGHNLPKQPAGIENRPWLLEELLIPANESVPLPRFPKLEITQPFTIQGPVIRNDAERGTLNISFDTDGRIHAEWQAEYAYDQKATHMAAEMAGNIHMKQTYSDQNGKDKSRLFFIAKGSYTKSLSSESGIVPEEQGTVYLLGWIRPDQTAQAHITITQNKEWIAVYESRNISISK